MIEIRDILCPIDFSDCSRRALDHAVTIAKWHDSRVTLLHVFNILPVVAYVEGGETLPATPVLCADRDALVTSVQKFADAEVGSSVPLTCDVAEGDIADTVLSKARTLRSDLIVMGTHGRSGLERVILGSVTNKVLRRSECPVLSVPPRMAEVVPISSTLFTQIVCAVDFSPCSMHALAYAMSLAQEADAHLTLVHVIETPVVSEDLHETIAGGPRSLREYVAAAERERRQRLEEAVPEAVRAYCHVDIVLSTGTPYREILRVAAERVAGLIVCGVHGRGAIDRFVFGSTTEQLVRHASCAVLSLRGTEADRARVRPRSSGAVAATE
jgi:nucleotide-binding universal stress UspA family protein